MLYISISTSFIYMDCGAEPLQYVWYTLHGYGGLILFDTPISLHLNRTGDTMYTI